MPEVRQPIGVAAGATLQPVHLRMSLPDLGSIFRLIPSLPLEVQRIPMEAWVSTDIRPMLASLEFRLDDQVKISVPVTTPNRVFWAPTVGQHRVVVHAVLLDGSVLTGKPIRFTVIN